MCPVPERWWRDENQNPVEVPTQQHQRPCSPNMNDAEYYGAEVGGMFLLQMLYYRGFQQEVCNP